MHEPGYRSYITHPSILLSCICCLIFYIGFSAHINVYSIVMTGKFNRTGYLLYTMHCASS